MACAVAVDSPVRPPRDRINVRLFITSYSDEFFAERDMLRKDVLPELRAWCEKRKLNLLENFIKWGGRHPDQRDVTELEKMQTSIENSYYSDIMPLFINITSEALGWVPMWGEYADEVIEDYLEANGLLVEDLELLKSAYRDDNMNSLFLFRDDSFLDKVPEEEKSCFVQKTSASQKTCGPNNKIQQKFPAYRIIEYGCEYKGLDHKRRPVLKFSDDLKHRIGDFLQQRVLCEYCGEDSSCLVEHPDSTALSAHRNFLYHKSSSVHGRETLVRRIEEYISQEDKDVPLLLLGGPGCGKSSVICSAANSVLTKVEGGSLPVPGGGDKKWSVFYHFVGAIRGSTSLECMLMRLLREFELAKNNNMPKEVDSASMMCCSMLSNPNTKPLVIFIDALNQFTEENAARVISWLPRKLAPHVRCVLTMVQDTAVHQALVARETKPLEVTIPPLDLQSRKNMVAEMLNRYGKQLNEDQMSKLMSKESSDNPLWLSVVCEELRRLDENSHIDDKISELPEGLLSILDGLLAQLEKEEGGDLLVATLCLLEASAAGLLDSELRALLADESVLRPPSPYEEKEEKETQEKESKQKKRDLLSERKWQWIFSRLQPYLRPYGESTEGRLDFYHSAVSKAVRKRYFMSESGDNERGEQSTWWHLLLAKFFQNHDNLERRAEEWPHQLLCLGDHFHLSAALSQWSVFDRLYNEEYSSQLLSYWRKVGPMDEMVAMYSSALSHFEEDDSVNEEAVSLRYEKVCRVVIQAGKYYEALELLKTAMKIEEKELGARPHRMVELYALMSMIYDEKLKLNDFVSPCQVPDLKKTIYYGRKSIAIRKTLPGNYHRFKLAMSLMKLAFNMESWDACGAGPELTGAAAIAEGNKYIDRALKIFMELNDMGHYAEALMTKGVLARRGSMEQLKLYNSAMELCMQMYGEYHILTSRLYINIGIVYEDNKDYRKAYTYFKRWARVSEEILGPEHPKTQRAKGVLRESRYRRIAQDLGEWDSYEDADDDNNDNNSGGEDGEEEENADLEHHYDDMVSVVNIQMLTSQDEVQLGSNMWGDNNETTSTTTAAATASSSSHPTTTATSSSSDSDDQTDVVMNGFVEERASAEDEDPSACEENADSENLYDDNFEDYEEQYIFSSESGPPYEDLSTEEETLNLEEENDNDFDLNEIANLVLEDCDNRFAADAVEEDSNRM
ncbi:TPR repeat-containing protein DDB_G0287407-like [Babylonia areolata]|uniref:TPR repeat-containing protein DDB_G0287407-like n=1 Tax=Babylonia areolata TaxID=304850 RepID=UPI003FD31CBE